MPESNIIVNIKDSIIFRGHVKPHKTNAGEKLLLFCMPMTKKPLWECLWELNDRPNSQKSLRGDRKAQNACLNS